MLHSLKPFLVLSLMIGIPGTIMVWLLDRIDLTTRLGFTLPTLAALGLMLLPDRRQDGAPDFLRSLVGSFFERDGLCFTLLPAIEHDKAFFHLFFQNRFEGSCRAQVVIKPSRQFWLNRRPIGDWTLGVECDGGAFGVVVIPFSLPAEFQGQAQSFEIAAYVEYPAGRGGVYRHREGVLVGNVKLEGWRKAVSVAGALGGNLVLWKPATLRIRLPTGLAKEVEVSDDDPILVETLWRPGEPVSPMLTRLTAVRSPAADPKAGLYRLRAAGPS